MEYVAAHFDLEELLPFREILLYELGELGFESFEEHEEGLSAYIPSDHFNKQALDEMLVPYADQFKWELSFETIPQQNWNAQWESNFHPIVVNEKCSIRAPFHPSFPNTEIELIIRPQMSFGTGHHETTWLMSRRIFGLELKNKSLLDMGCGTGVLAILAAKLGAGPITAIDIDEWSYENTLENNQLNNISGMIVEKGDASLLAGRSFQVILANINRNVLLADMGTYATCLQAGGRILFSGFFVSDVETIRQAAEKQGLIFEGQDEKNNWVVLEFKKS